MKNTKRIAFAFWAMSAALVALHIGCVTPPEYPIEPHIEFISLTKDTLRRGISNDTTFATFSFTDGDGDIGSKDTLDLFLTDNRDGTLRPLQIPFVPELGASNGIKGEITARLFTTCCIFPDQFLNGCTDVMPSFPYDQVVYSLYIVDRKGHQSNTIDVGPIYVRCFE